MGFFDVSVTHKTTSSKENLAIKTALQSTLQQNGFEKTIIEKQETIKNYQVPKALLKYDLTFHEDNNNFIIQGELQQTLLLAILIILSILFTYGIGVVLVVGYVFYQRMHTSKALTQLIKSIQGTQLA